MKEVARKHKIGKRERIRLENELKALREELKALTTKNSEGFEPFYDDLEANTAKVRRSNWLEEVLNRGFYHIVKRIDD